MTLFTYEIHLFCHLKLYYIICLKASFAFPPWFIIVAVFMTVRATGEPDRACHWWRQGTPRLDLRSFLYESKYRNFIAHEKAKDNKRFLFFFFSLSLFWLKASYSPLDSSTQASNKPLHFFKKIFRGNYPGVFKTLPLFNGLRWMVTYGRAFDLVSFNLNSEFNRIVNWNIHFHVCKGKLNKRNKIKRMLHSLPGQFISNVMILNLYNS